MGGCLTKQNIIEPNSKVLMSSPVKCNSVFKHLTEPENTNVNEIEIKFINIIRNKYKKYKKYKKPNIKKVILKSLNKIPLRKKPKKHNRPPFKYLV